jgi:hypothetical protein
LFVCEPELLVFDDLSSALDVETEPAAMGDTPHRRWFGFEYLALFVLFRHGEHCVPQ